MAKWYGSPLFNIRLKTEMYDWLRDYAKRQGKPMAQILKEHLNELKRKDERTQQQKEA